MGYTEGQCIKAFKKCLNGKFEDALNFLLDNPDDKGEDEIEEKDDKKEKKRKKNRTTKN